MTRPGHARWAWHAGTVVQFFMLSLLMIGCATPRIIPIRATDPAYTRQARLQQMLATTAGYPVEITVAQADSTRSVHWGYITRLRNDTLSWSDGRSGQHMRSAPIVDVRLIVCSGCRRDYRPTGAVAGIILGYAVPIVLQSVRTGGGFTATSMVAAVAGGFLGWFIGASQSSTEVRWEM